MQKIDFNVWLEQLKAKSDIVSILSSYMKLDRKGKNYWACCPFHHEKTPSFCVYGNEQFYHCYGCKEHGDVITFIEKMENCDFIDAIKLLADKCGMQVPTFENDDGEIEKRKQKKELMLKILDMANKHYQENLLKPISKPAQEYIKARLINRKALEEFQLGYSINWTEIVNYFNKQGISNADLKEAGVIEIKDNGYAYDVMAERLIFPIFNNFNDCVGFSSRILVKSDMAKYKNTTQTLIFDKSRLVFGMQVLKRLKKEGNLSSIIIVEGQIDVISMYRAGFENTIASCGTALTAEHAKMLNHYCENVILCFDGDSAGIKATLSAIDILIENGLNVKVVKLPNGKDPDEVIKQNGQAEMQKYIDEAIPAIDYKIYNASQKLDMSNSADRTEFIKRSLEIINKLSTESEKQVHLELVKKISNVPIDILRRDLETKELKKVEKAKNEVAETEESTANKFETYVLASLLFKKDYANYEVDLLPLLKNPSHKKLYQTMVEKNQKCEKLIVSTLYDIFKIDEEPNIVNIINYNFENNESKTYYDACVWNLYDNYLTDKQKQLSLQYSEQEEPEKRKEIMKQIQEISIQKKSKKVGKI